MIKFLDLKAVTSLHGVEIENAVERVVASGWYLQGEENQKFESHYSEYIGTKYTIGCGNGLDALTLILRAYIEMGIMNPGDEVLVPANTYIASILAITENGLQPVLVEPNPETLEIDDEQLLPAITDKTKAIMVVHLYGRCAFSMKMLVLCKLFGLKLIEDNAQAHGCYFSERGMTPARIRTGELGDAAGHSFYPGKNLGALGDGGAVTTNDPDLAEMVRAMTNYGSRKKYVFEHLGRNSRLDEIQAAVLDVKLKYLDEDNERRRKIAHYYYEHINNPEVVLPRQMKDENNVYHLFPVLCEKRNDLQRFLLENGVETLIHYPIPPHKQLCYFDRFNGEYPVTEMIHERELSLPISPVMTLKEAKDVVDLVNLWS